MEVPFDPKRVAVMDMAALDILEQLGLEDVYKRQHLLCPF